MAAVLGLAGVLAGGVHVAPFGRVDGVADWLRINRSPVVSSRGVGGSSWASWTDYTTADGTRYFCKRSPLPASASFQCEALGLRALAATDALRVPAVIRCGDDLVSADGGSYLLLEHLGDLQPVSPRNPRGMRMLGHALARVHATPAAALALPGWTADCGFGFPLAGSIGGTVQPNGWHADWVAFFRERRIGHQLALARDSELRAEWSRVCKHTNELRGLFADGPVAPSLLHGDLWEGNFACIPCAAGADGEDAVQVCAFDPAAYLGHHEAEWGMAWCAGFSADFWAGYREALPEAAGFEARRPLYELYHKLNHYNLFGGEYRAEALELMELLQRGPSRVI